MELSSLQEIHELINYLKTQPKPEQEIKIISMKKKDLWLILNMTTNYSRRLQLPL